MRRAVNARHRARRTAAQWQELVERFERAGQSRSKFCAAHGHGLALRTFDLWRRKLRAAPVEEDHREALFVELTSPAQTRTSPPSTGTGSWEVELELGAGMVLRLRRAAPSRTVRSHVLGRILGCSSHPICVLGCWSAGAVRIVPHDRGYGWARARLIGS